MTKSKLFKPTIRNVHAGVEKRKLSSGFKWRYYGSFKGKKFTSATIYDTEAEALAARQEKLIELVSGATNAKLFHLIQQRISFLELDKTSKYAKESEDHLEIAKKAWGDVPVQTITKGMVKSLLNKEAKRLQKAGKQNYAVNALLRILKAFFQYCIDDYDLEMRNPCKGIKPFHIEKKVKYIPPDDEIDFIKGLLNEDQNQLVDFVHQTACRINEALNFKVEDIDHEKNLITLWTRKSKNSNLTFRRIPIPDCLLGMQKEGKLPRSGRVFSQWNTHPKFIEKAIRNYNKWGIDPDTVTNLPKNFEHLPAWSWHNLRHKQASE